MQPDKKVGLQGTIPGETDIKSHHQTAAESHSNGNGDGIANSTKALWAKKLADLQPGARLFEPPQSLEAALPKINADINSGLEPPQNLDGADSPPGPSLWGTYWGPPEGLGPPRTETTPTAPAAPLPSWLPPEGQQESSRR